MSTAISAKKVAGKLGIGESTVYRLAKDKRIPHIRIDSRVVFYEETVDEWIAQQEVKPEVSNPEVINA